MKLLVIDDALAFCGGIDMTTGRWDTREHMEERPGRRTSWNRPLGPWHDGTTCVSGPVAGALADLARRRWFRATGEEVDALASDSDPWPEELPVDLAEIDVGIARTEPAYEEYPQICEIEAATLATIRCARRSLYIESQYFASRTIAKAIADRLAEPDGPEVVIVNPDTADGWLEAEAMDSARIRMMHLVKAADTHDRFRIYYPVNEAGSSIYVHAKIMIADERILKIGSANLNNRSMGFDTECDLVIEARDDEEATQAAIRAKRDGLLAEHMGREVAEVAVATSACAGSLIGAIDRLNTNDRRLVPLPDRALTLTEEAFAESDLTDPERPTRLKDKVPRILRRR
jgi:phospholipase D1/2